MQVQDVENLSQAEEEALFKELNALSNSHSQWNFTVKDANTALRFYEADGDSYITGPNNERIKAKMILEGEVSDNFGNSLFGNSEKVPFGLVEQVPVFPGCENAEDTRACFNQHMQEHIRKNFRYPQEAIDQGIQGRVNILFTIDQSGKVTGIRKRGPSEYLENEAVRIIEKLPQMKPGMQQGAAVQVPYSIPITFSLSN
jgi:TonB family protein